MGIQVGQQLGSLQITALIGKGGMGEVYRARDTKLKREVAIKILPDEFARDADRVNRFQREAEVLASLSHPNIAGIYDLQHTVETRFLVMELVEGETLAERIARGRIPLDEALGIAKSICEALESAHEKGIVHRDLKPANVKITPDGAVKVLDFGLAKALDSGPAAIPLSNSPTLLSGTMGGMIIGTAAYMSPEQARGREADQRSDIFSFGCVLYEMLTGRQAFQGEDVSDVLASVMKIDPKFDSLPANLDPRMKELLRRCLAKNRKERWYAIGDVRVEVQRIIDEPPRLSENKSGTRSSWKLIAAFVLFVIVASAVSGVIGWSLRRPQLPLPTRFSFTLPEGQVFTTTARQIIAMSPDGRNVVYTANQQLYLRSLNDTEPHPIRGTNQNPHTPFFSPDGRWIGFISASDGKLKKIGISGGAAVTISDLDNPYGVSWGADDQIYIGYAGKGILRVPANGGTPETIVSVKPGEAAYGPQLIAGETILFTLRGSGSWDQSQIVVQSLRSGARKVVLSGGADARYLPTGHLIYAVENTLFGVPFNLQKIEVAGGPVPILEHVSRSLGGFSAAAQFASSTDGAAVYVDGTLRETGNGNVLLVDRTGGRKVLDIEPDGYTYPRLSPDGKQLTINSSRDSVVWVYDLKGGTPRRRLTFGGQAVNPLWSPDGQRIAFSFRRDGESALFWQRADGSGTAERLVKVENNINPQSEAWTRDGKTLIFTARLSPGSGGIFALSVGTDEKPKLLIPPPATNASLSADGKWFAYHSSETGRNEIYIQPYPPTGAKYQVTANGGTSPLWSPDGKQLFYVNASTQLMQVEIQTQPSFVVGKTNILPIEGVLANGARTYDITPDGKYFVVMIPKSETEGGRPAPQQINVVTNWFEDLKQRVPVP